MTPFDPNAAATADSGIFGLRHSQSDAVIHLIPVPFAATVSYGGGAELGPDAILAASRQVDLFDLQNGRPYERGICMLPPDPRLRTASDAARALVVPMLARGGATAADAAELAAIDAAGALVNDIVGAQTRRVLAAGRVPGIVGGDHSVPFGAIAAAATAHPGLGILHLDAHADLRVAYEGFRWSHASIMDNVLREVDGVARLVQVGIRDFCEDEHRAIVRSEGRVITHFDLEWGRRRALGEPFDALCHEVVAALPQQVWVSFDIDGLDPALCPGTGTPVPGGLQFGEMCHLLDVLAQSGRRIVGFDLVEVAPGVGEWDANVGARVLYKLCGFALRTR
ncbi:MAG: agmatinase family protein [Planctomycetes bacterium]|nr:agmatinase family protein [Planctomycetota bacterium]